MKLTDLLLTIESISQAKGLSQPYIVGGLVRDKLISRVDTIKDVDITTGDDTVFNLAQEVSNYFNVPLKVFPNSNSKLTLSNFTIDFSSNFRHPQVGRILTKFGVKNPTEMQKELYSRDFTCNAGLMTMDLSKIIDPTGLAIEDINNKIIKTLLPPSITLGYDVKRIVRAIYLSAKLNFEIDDKTKKWIKTHPKFFREIPHDYVTKKINMGLDYNTSKVYSLLRELNLIDYLPDELKYEIG